MKKVFVHVGYPKTGTTSLQSNLFSRHSQIFDFREEVDGVGNIRKNICNSASLDFRHLHCRVKKEIKKSSKDVIVYSEETYTGNLEHISPEGINRCTVASRLSNIFEQENVSKKVLIVIRRQQSILLSAFSFWYHTYKEMGYADVDRLIFKAVEESESTAKGILSWLFYLETVRGYINSFGENNVHVLLYEDMKSDTESFVRHLSSLMGIDGDESARLMESSTDRNVTQTDTGYQAPSKMYHWLSTLKSRFFPNVGSLRSVILGQWFLNWVRAGRTSEITLSESSVSRLRTLYGNNNRKLQEELNLPLEEYGYYIA